MALGSVLPRARTPGLGGVQRVLLVAAALLGPIVVAFVVAVAVWSGATLQTDATALAHVNLQPLAGSLEQATAVGRDGKSIPLSVHDGLLTPLTQVSPGETVSVDVVIRRPGLLSWALGKTRRERLTFTAPVAHVADPWVTIRVRARRSTVNVRPARHRGRLRQPPAISTARPSPPPSAPSRSGRGRPPGRSGRRGRPTVGEAQQAGDRDLVPTVELARDGREPGSRRHAPPAEQDPTDLLHDRDATRSARRGRPSRRRRRAPGTRSTVTPSSSLRRALASPSAAQVHVVLPRSVSVTGPSGTNIQSTEPDLLDGPDRIDRPAPAAARRAGLPPAVVGSDRTPGRRDARAPRRPRQSLRRPGASSGATRTRRPS